MSTRPNKKRVSLDKSFNRFKGVHILASRNRMKRVRVLTVIFLGACQARGKTVSRRYTQPRREYIRPPRACAGVDRIPLRHRQNLHRTNIKRILSAGWQTSVTANTTVRRAWHWNRKENERVRRQGLLRGYRLPLSSSAILLAILCRRRFSTDGTSYSRLTTAITNTSGKATPY